MNIAKSSFLISGIYDFILGLIFLIIPSTAYNYFNVTPPNHWGYVTFSAAMLVIFGIMFLKIAKDPKNNKNFMPYGIMLKIAYIGTVFSYYFTSSIPTIWVIFGVIDFIFLLLFVYSYKRI